jgi:hypothetical protein
VTRHTKMMAIATTAGVLLTIPVVTHTSSPVSPVRQTNDDQKVTISAWAVNMSNIGTGTTFNVEFDVNRWTKPDEREMLITTMIENGPDALLKKLQQMPSHGRMRVVSPMRGRDPLQLQLGWDLRYAWQEKTDEGGRRIVLGTDRYITWWEAANRPRTIDYPFTVIEIHANAEGKGEGKLSIASKINFDKKKNKIELETYASEPIRLQNVEIKPRT